MNEAISDSRTPIEAAGAPSAENLETMGHLQRAIELAQGFALFFACCDQPALRDDLIALMEERLARQGYRSRRLEVVPPAAGLLAGLKTVCRIAEAGKRPACIHVCGLEEVLSPGVNQPPLLSQLNLARENYRDLPCALVFWLSNAALIRLAQGAPDFWAWRSGSFDFSPQWAYGAGPVEAPARTQAEEQIRVLESLLADYRSLGDGRMEQRARADLLVELAALYQATYRPQAARQRLAEALPLLGGLADDNLESRAREVQHRLEAVET